MIKIVVGKTVFLGLTQDNIDRLLLKQPILFDGAEIFHHGFKIAIFVNKTSNDLLQDLKDHGIEIPHDIV